MAEAVNETGIAEIGTVAGQGMIALRGDKDAAAVLKEAADRLGVAMPGPLEGRFKGEAGLLWMSPDELLALCPAADLAGHLDALGAAMAGHHAMALDVSDIRVRFTVSGPLAREVLAKICPLDMSPEGFTPGMVRRTKLGQVAGAIWLGKDGVFHVICFRSVGDYVHDLLRIAAQPGSEVHLFTPPAA